MVVRREALKKDQTTEIPNLPDFGFFNNPDVVASMYWERRNSDYKMSVNDGGMLEQEMQLSDDLATYHEIVMWAEAVVKKNKSGAPPMNKSSFESFEDM